MTGLQRNRLVSKWVLSVQATCANPLFLGFHAASEKEKDKEAIVTRKPLVLEVRRS